MASIGMSLDDIKEYKQLTEKTIFNLLEDFEKNTHTSISNIDLDIIETSSYQYRKKSIINGVKLKIKI